ncbi:hypothetical protein LOD99_13225 [Oopsacas minuta]|uniref:Uncharacterized protein n=1 Tax=Oopsacas minuta TaxID=111878 RepID=A0AAV7JBD1_9METZ|nr:hypothetical protein LOD99_13225 [Oopsacas minuta]
MAYYLPDFVSDTEIHPNSEFPDNLAANPPAIGPYSHSTSINSLVPISSNASPHPLLPEISYQTLPADCHTNYNYVSEHIQNLTGISMTTAYSKNSTETGRTDKCSIKPKNTL